MSGNHRVIVASIAVWLVTFCILLLGDFHFSWATDSWKNAGGIGLIAVAAVLTAVAFYLYRSRSHET